MEIITLLLALFYIFTPIIILHLCHTIPFVNKLGSVIIAYAIGLLVGNIGILPSMGSYLNEYLLLNPKTNIEAVEALLDKGLITGSDVLAFKIYKLRDMLMSITILLAIPLVLFSANVKAWGNMAGKSFLSMVTGFFAVVFVVVVGYFMFKGKGMPDLWKLSGMLVGVYTGGTPNLAALKMMLDVDANIYILAHTYDLIVGVVYLAFLMTIARRIFGYILPSYPVKLEEAKIRDLDGKDPFWGIFRREVFLPLLRAYALTFLIVAIGGGLAMLVPENMLMVVVILSITTLGLLASLIPSINRIEKTFESGMYLILIFSLVVASMADVRNFAGITPGLFGYITWTVFGSLLVHVLLARIFRIDTDTVIITSTAMVCSPPFVPVVAGAIKNKNVIVPGITIGIIGYAVGNYLGYALANILSYF